MSKSFTEFFPCGTYSPLSGELTTLGRPLEGPMPPLDGLAPPTPKSCALAPRVALDEAKTIARATKPTHRSRFRVIVVPPAFLLLLLFLFRDGPRRRLRRTGPSFLWRAFARPPGYADRPAAAESD